MNGVANSCEVEVFCPHCREALWLLFSGPVQQRMLTVGPRFDRTIENPAVPARGWHKGIGAIAMTNCMICDLYAVIDKHLDGDGADFVADLVTVLPPRGHAFHKLDVWQRTYRSKLGVTTR